MNTKSEEPIQVGGNSCPCTHWDASLEQHFFKCVDGRLISTDCGVHWSRNVEIQERILAEREACAKIVQWIITGHPVRDFENFTVQEAVKLIRSRPTNTKSEAPILSEEQDERILPEFLADIEDMARDFATYAVGIPQIAFKDLRHRDRMLCIDAGGWAHIRERELKQSLFAAQQEIARLQDQVRKMLNDRFYYERGLKDADYEVRQLKSATTQQVLEEREACANIAEYHFAGRSIANAIRSRPTPGA